MHPRQCGSATSRPLESAAVRRLLFVFLLVLLPLQLSAAALMPYCQHDGAGGEWHPGHHAHLHADSKAAGDVDLPGQLELDCSHCHAHGGALPATLSAPAQALPRDAVRRSPSAHPPMRALAPPERPQWPRLA